MLAKLTYIYVGVLRGWGRAQITVDILGREAKKVEKHWTRVYQGTLGWTEVRGVVWWQTSVLTKLQCCHLPWYIFIISLTTTQRVDFVNNFLFILQYYYYVCNISTQQNEAHFVRFELFGAPSKDTVFYWYKGPSAGSAMFVVDWRCASTNGERAQEVDYLCTFRHRRIVDSALPKFVYGKLLLCKKVSICSFEDAFLGSFLAPPPFPRPGPWLAFADGLRRVHGRGLELSQGRIILSASLWNCRE